jgi:hypothetical protein
MDVNGWESSTTKLVDLEAAGGLKQEQVLNSHL